MTGVDVFFAAAALGIVGLLAVIARDCSAIADMLHDDRENRRHG